MPRRRKEDFMLKWRLVPTRRMTVGEAKQLLFQAVRTRRVPEGIEIREMDWFHGKGERYVRGDSIAGSDLASMGDFAASLRGEGRRVRIERV